MQERKGTGDQKRIEFILNKVLFLYISTPYPSPYFSLDRKVTKANPVESATLGYIQVKLAHSSRLNALFKTWFSGDPLTFCVRKETKLASLQTIVSFCDRFNGRVPTRKTYVKDNRLINAVIRIYSI